MPKKLELDAQIIELVNQKKSGSQIAESLGINRTTVMRKLKKLGIHLYNYHNELKFDETIFDYIDTEDKAYWLGFIFADGSIRINKQGTYVFELSLKGSDKEHLYKFNSFMKYKGDNVKLSKTTCNNKVFSRCRWVIANKHLFDTLNSYGCTPNKSLTLQFPNINIFKDTNLIRDFIRGYVDGDGCVGLQTHKIKATTLNLQIIGTKEFLTKVIEYLPDTTIMLKDKRTLHNTYFVFYCSDKAKRACDFLYKDSNIWLQRKFDIYRFAVSQSNL